MRLRETVWAGVWACAMAGCDVQPVREPSEAPRCGDRADSGRAGDGDDADGVDAGRTPLSEPDAGAGEVDDGGGVAETDSGPAKPPGPPLRMYDVTATRDMRGATYWCVPYDPPTADPYWSPGGTWTLQLELEPYTIEIERGPYPVTLACKARTTEFLDWICDRIYDPSWPQTEAEQTEHYEFTIDRVEDTITGASTQPGRVATGFPGAGTACTSYWWIAGARIAP